MCIHCERRKAARFGTTVDEIAYLEQKVASMRERVEARAMHAKTPKEKWLIAPDIAELSNFEKILASVHSSTPEDALRMASKANEPDPFSMDDAVAKAANGMKEAIDREVLEQMSRRVANANDPISMADIPDIWTNRMRDRLHAEVNKPILAAAKRKSALHQKLRRMYRERLSDEQKLIHGRDEFLSSIPRWAMQASYNRLAKQTYVAFPVSSIVFDTETTPT